MSLVAPNTAGNMDPAAIQTPPPCGRPRLTGPMNMAALKPQKNVITTVRDSLPAPYSLIDSHSHQVSIISSKGYRLHGSCNHMNDTAMTY